MSQEHSLDHTLFQSPFTWRYGSHAMRAVWSQAYQRRLWRRVWVALAEAEAEFGLVTAEQAGDVRMRMDDVNLGRAAEIEAEIRHDLMAELRAFAEQCPLGGGILHLGATSADIQDNADALRLRDALDLVLAGLRDALIVVAEQIDRWADVVTIGFTHIQPAEPTTIGYRLAQYGQDLLTDWQELRRVRGQVRGKGIKGAVGTSASYAELLDGSTHAPKQLEERVMSRLGIDAFPVTTQTSPRKQDWLVLTALAGLAASLHKLMFDLRVLQSPMVGEWSEPFREKQVGSSAMPFKRNPITAEKVDSLARWVAALPRIAWDNAALSLLERTLDDSANRRLFIPEAFLAIDEMLSATRGVLGDLRINQDAVSRNLATWGTFAAVERLLMALVKAGSDRQDMHERLRTHSMSAWAVVSGGGENPLCELLRADEAITRYIAADEVLRLMDGQEHIGDAPERARQMSAIIQREVQSADK